MASRLKMLFLAFALLGGLYGLSAWSSYQAKKRELVKHGVLHLSEQAVQPGLNLFCSMNQPRAFLVDMQGRPVHSWRGRGNDPRGWHYVRLGEGGNLYSVMTDTDVRLTDWNSKIIWRRQGRFHHDVDVSQSGRVYTLARKDERVLFQGREVRILNDYITVLDAHGKIAQEISLYSLVQDLIPEELMLAAEQYAVEKAPRYLQNDTPADIFHANTLQYIGSQYTGEVFQPGQVLVGIRELHRAVVVDLEQEKRVWEWGNGELQKPHHPNLLANGNLLVFDNGVSRGYSRVLELDPATKEIVWSYGERESERFYSAYRGGAQRLANGNTLIAIGEAGEAIEVTPTGEKVWHFRTTRWKNKKKERRETLYRITRIEDVARLLEFKQPIS